MRTRIVRFSEIMAHPRRSLLPADYLPLPFPMPGDRIEKRTVVASAEYFDDERGSVALVLLLNQQPPYFTVAHYALTDVKGGEGIYPEVVTEYTRGEVDVIGSFENIVPAVREYEQSGGDY